MHSAKLKVKYVPSSQEEVMNLHFVLINASHFFSNCFIIFAFRFSVIGKRDLIKSVNKSFSMANRNIV